MTLVKAAINIVLFRANRWLVILMFEIASLVVNATITGCVLYTRNLSFVCSLFLFFSTLEFFYSQSNKKS